MPIWFWGLHESQPIKLAFNSATTGPQRHDMKMRQDLDKTTIKKKWKKKNLLTSLVGVQSQNCDSQTWKRETKPSKHDNTTTSTDHKGQGLKQ